MIPTIHLGIQKGDIVLTPQGQSCTVIGVSMAGRATIRDEEGVVIAIDADQLKKVAPAFGEAKVKC